MSSRSGPRRVAVVGGGIVGTAVAREVAHRLPDSRVVLLEKEQRLAAHQTGHNSGVVHAGLYYEPGSLKARLCRRGVGLLQDVVARHDVPYDACGKLVVALDRTEEDRLRAIHARAVANGVPDAALVGPERIRELEPHVTGRLALHSPHTAIVDFVALTEALAGELRAAGGEVRLGSPVTGVTRRGGDVLLTTPAGPGGGGAHDLVIACAGLQSDRLAALAGDAAEPRIVPFSGDYLLLRPERAHLVHGLVYPVPDPRYPFLGVHLTRRVDGAVLVGPNAFLSPAREGYRGRPDRRDLLDVIGYPGFWRFAAHNVPAAARELRTATSRRQFVAEARRYVAELGADDVLPGPRGIRAQAMWRDGRLVDDFVVTGDDRLVHVRNAPSPGATSALAIAEHVVGEALSRAAAP